MTLADRAALIRRVALKPSMLGIARSLYKPRPGTAGTTVTGKGVRVDRKSTRLNSSHVAISYAVFCLKKKIQVGAKRLRSALTASAVTPVRGRAGGRATAP